MGLDSFHASVQKIGGLRWFRISFRHWPDVSFCNRTGHPQRLCPYPDNLEWSGVQFLTCYEPYSHVSYCAEGLVSSLVCDSDRNRFPYHTVRHVFRMLSGVTRNLGTAQVLVLVIESGMIYSAALIIEISCYFSGSNAFYIVYDPIAQLTVRFTYLSSFIYHSSHWFRKVNRADHDPASRCIQTNVKRHQNSCQRIRTAVQRLHDFADRQLPHQPRPYLYDHNDRNT